MAIILANSVYPFAAATIFAIFMSIVLRVFYAARSKAKFKEYQSEIARSHSKILKLEVKNEKLQQRINELDDSRNMSKIA